MTHTNKDFSARSGFGWGIDVLARATRQAVVRTVRMTTKKGNLSMANAKSMRKRIAAVASVAMGLGLLSAAPALAADVNASYQYVSAISLAADESSNAVVGQTVRINMGAVTTAFDPAGGDIGNAYFAGYLSTYPADADTTVTANKGSVTSLCSSGATFGCSAANVGPTIHLYSSTSGKKILGETVEADSTTNAGYFTFVPDTVGTYVLTVFHDANGDGSLGALEARKTISVAVVAPQLSVSKSSVTLTAGTNSYGTKSSTLGITSVYAPKSVATTGFAAQVDVDIEDSAGNPLVVDALAVTSTGPGFVSDNSTRGAGNFGALLTNKTNLSSYTFYFYADGNGGKATATFKATTLAGDVVTLGTATIYYYGAVAKLKAEAVFSAYSGTSDAAVEVTATDANDIKVPGVAVKGASGNLTDILSGWSCVETASKGAAITTDDAPGVSECTPGAATDKQGTGSYTFTSGSAATADLVTSNAASVLVTSAKPATVTIAFDKASYLPGAAVVMTITVKNAEGNPVADNGTYTGFFTSIVGAGLNLAPTAGIDLTPGTYNDMAAAGQHQVKFFAPVADGDWTVIATPSSIKIAAASATMKVTPTPSVSALQAQVAALTTTITAIQTAIATLVASTSATLTVLTNKINKIMKKLKIK